MIERGGVEIRRLVADRPDLAARVGEAEFAQDAGAMMPVEYLEFPGPARAWPHNQRRIQSTVTDVLGKRLAHARNHPISVPAAWEEGVESDPAQPWSAVGASWCVRHMIASGMVRERRWAFQHRRFLTR